MGCGSSNSVETKESKKTNQNLDKIPEKEEEKQNKNFRQIMILKEKPTKRTIKIAQILSILKLKIRIIIKICQIRKNKLKKKI